MYMFCLACSVCDTITISHTHNLNSAVAQKDKTEAATVSIAHASGIYLGINRLINIS